MFGIFSENKLTVLSASSITIASKQRQGKVAKETADRK